MADTTPAVKTAPETSDAYAIVEASGTQIWLQTNRYYDPVSYTHLRAHET